MTLAIHFHEWEQEFTDDALDWVDCSQHSFEDFHQGFVLQDALLKHCQEVLVTQTTIWKEFYKIKFNFLNIFQFRVLFYSTGSKINLKFSDNHEAQKSIQSVESKCTQSVLDLRKQPFVRHLLVTLQVVPGVQLVDVAGNPVEKTCSSSCLWRWQKAHLSTFHHLFPWGYSIGFLWADILWICDSQDLSAQTADESGRFIHRGKLRNGDVGGLVHTLPVLDLNGGRKKNSIINKRQDFYIMMADFAHFELIIYKKKR